MDAFSTKQLALHGLVLIHTKIFIQTRYNNPRYNDENLAERS